MTRGDPRANTPVPTPTRSGRVGLLVGFIEPDAPVNEPDRVLEMLVACRLASKDIRFSPFKRSSINRRKGRQGTWTENRHTNRHNFTSRSTTYAGKPVYVRPAIGSP